jgi:hypothetical protein
MRNLLQSEISVVGGGEPNGCRTPEEGSKNYGDGSWGTDTGSGFTVTGSFSAGLMQAASDCADMGATVGFPVQARTGNVQIASGAAAVGCVVGVGVGIVRDISGSR